MELLPDPKNDRVVKTLTPPVAKPLHSELLWSDIDDKSKLISNHKLEDIARSPETRRRAEQIRYHKDNKASQENNG